MSGHADKKKHGKWRCLLFIALVMSLTGVSAQEEKLRVGFICAATADHPFWGQVIQVMQAAANDLNIDLIIKYDPTRSTYATKKIGSQLINSEPKLDYLLTKYWLGVTATHIEQARQRGIKVFIFNSDVPESEYEATGRFPRQKYTNWIGHMVPDDNQAGYDLAKILIERAREIKSTREKKRIRVLGLNGPFESTVGTNRLGGLKKRIQETPDAVLEDTVVTNWMADDADKSIVNLLKLHPDTDVLWAPNESITWGAVQAAEHSGKTPGKDIVIGGFDWNAESIKAIADGRIAASMFGHFLEGAWALILVNDYHYGFDFANNPGTRISTPLAVIDAGNYERYITLLRKDSWEKIDFRKFSKKYNPELKEYNFNINQFL